MRSADDLSLLDLLVDLRAQAALARQHRVIVVPVPAGAGAAKPRAGQGKTVRKARRRLRPAIPATANAALEAGLAQTLCASGAVDRGTAVEGRNVTAARHAANLLDHAQEADRRHAPHVDGADRAVGIFVDSRYGSCIQHTIMGWVCSCPLVKTDAYALADVE